MNFVDRIFVGELTNTIMCEECEHVSECVQIILKKTEYSIWKLECVANCTSAILFSVENFLLITLKHLNSYQDKVAFFSCQVLTFKVFFLLKDDVLEKFKKKIEKHFKDQLKHQLFAAGIHHEMWELPRWKLKNSLEDREHQVWSCRERKAAFHFFSQTCWK